MGATGSPARWREDSAAWVILEPFDFSEAISVSRAAELANVSEPTIRKWCWSHGVGRQLAELGTPYRVSRPALQMLLDGQHDTLRRYRSGDRHSPDVQRYFERFSIPLPGDREAAR